MVFYTIIPYHYKLQYSIILYLHNNNNNNILLQLIICFKVIQLNKITQYLNFSEMLCLQIREKSHTIQLLIISVLVFFNVCIVVAL